MSRLSYSCHLDKWNLATIEQDFFFSGFSQILATNKTPSLRPIILPLPHQRCWIQRHGMAVRFQDPCISTKMPYPKRVSYAFSPLDEVFGTLLIIRLLTLLDLFSIKSVQRNRSTYPLPYERHCEHNLQSQQWRCTRSCLHSQNLVLCCRCYLKLLLFNTPPMLPKNS